MRTRTLPLFALIALLLPQASLAEVKTYSMDVVRVNNTTTLTITGRSFPSWQFGSVEINDESNAHPTLNEFKMLIATTRTGRVDVFAGPNSFIYTRNLGTTRPLPNQTGTGDTEGFVKWNPLSSWTVLGGRFCKGSNEVGNPLGGNICTVLQFILNGTAAGTVPSPTYDFPLWTFDAEGDFSAEPFLWQISSNGSANTDYQMSGILNVNVPALSILGFGILGASVLFLGVRALRSRERE